MHMDCEGVMTFGCTRMSHSRKRIWPWVKRGRGRGMDSQCKEWCGGKIFLENDDHRWTWHWRPWQLTKSRSVAPFPPAQRLSSRLYPLHHFPSRYLTSREGVHFGLHTALSFRSLDVIFQVFTAAWIWLIALTMEAVRASETSVEHLQKWKAQYPRRVSSWYNSVSVACCSHGREGKRAPDFSWKPVTPVISIGSPGPSPVSCSLPYLYM
jgi:hypothetical protein